MMGGELAIIRLLTKYTYEDSIGTVVVSRRDCMKKVIASMFVIFVAMVAVYSAKVDDSIADKI